MGGSPAVIAKARESFNKGEYRWVAQVMKHVVFAEPDNREARELEADALEQLGYQAESGPWRNAFLMGAFELRNGVPKVEGAETASPDTIRAMTPEMVLAYMAMRLDAQQAAGKRIAINWEFPDLKQTYAVEVEDSVLIYTDGTHLPEADATLVMPKTSLSDIQLGTTTLDAEVSAGRVKITGSKAKVGELMSMLVKFDPLFNIVTP
jgi:alkyl sulfatase BDS1-like metallo-beta-lactamase superfamily hydrolase